MRNATTCKKGSAWDTWMNHGANWRNAVYRPSREGAQTAAWHFAHEPGYPQAGISARYRAFLEGAGYDQLKLNC